MQLSAKAYFKDASSNNKKILIRSTTEVPRAWLIEFRKGARGAASPSTPLRDGALRRSIVTQMSDGHGEVGWRSAYAAAQNVGYHTRNGKRIYYRKYTTAGTGKGFARAAFQYANSKLPQIARQTGLTR